MRTVYYLSIAALLLWNAYARAHSPSHLVQVHSYSVLSPAEFTRTISDGDSRGQTCVLLVSCDRFPLRAFQVVADLVQSSRHWLRSHCGLVPISTSGTPSLCAAPGRGVQENCYERPRDWLMHRVDSLARCASGIPFASSVHSLRFQAHVVASCPSTRSHRRGPGLRPALPSCTLPGTPYPPAGLPGSASGTRFVRSLLAVIPLAPDARSSRCGR